jgi:hypothetical protein
MTKEEALQIIKLLSAMESWSFANNQKMPDYLLDKLKDAVAILEREVLK